MLSHLASCLLVDPEKHFGKKIFVLPQNLLKPVSREARLVDRFLQKLAELLILLTLFHLCNEGIL